MSNSPFLHSWCTRYSPRYQPYDTLKMQIPNCVWFVFIAGSTPFISFRQLRLRVSQQGLSRNGVRSSLVARGEQCQTIFESFHALSTTSIFYKHVQYWAKILAFFKQHSHWCVLCSRLARFIIYLKTSFLETQQLTALMDQCERGFIIVLNYLANFQCKMAKYYTNHLSHMRPIL